MYRDQELFVEALMYVAPRNPMFRKLMKLADGDIDLVTKALTHVKKQPAKNRSLAAVVSYIKNHKSREQEAA